MEVFNIGVDFGGVLSVHDSNFEDAQHRNISIDMPLAVENLLKLRELGHRLFLISFCGRARAIETLNSLKTTTITDTMTCAGLFEEIIFVKDIENKRNVCEHLNCHFMVDDREDVQLEVSKSACNTKSILFGAESHSSFITAKDWNEVSQIIASKPFFSTKSYFPRPVKMIYKLE